MPIYTSYRVRNTFDRAGRVVLYVKSGIELSGCVPVIFLLADIKLDIVYSIESFDKRII